MPRQSEIITKKPEEYRTIADPEEFRKKFVYSIANPVQTISTRLGVSGPKIYTYIKSGFPQIHECTMMRICIEARLEWHPCLIAYAKEDRVFPIARKKGTYSEAPK